MATACYCLRQGLKLDFARSLAQVLLIYIFCFAHYRAAYMQQHTDRTWTKIFPSSLARQPSRELDGVLRQKFHFTTQSNLEFCPRSNSMGELSCLESELFCREVPSSSLSRFTAFPRTQNTLNNCEQKHTNFLSHCIVLAKWRGFVQHLSRSFRPSSCCVYYFLPFLVVQNFNSKNSQVFSFFFTSSTAQALFFSCCFTTIYIIYFMPTTCTSGDHRHHDRLANNCVDRLREKMTKTKQTQRPPHISHLTLFPLAVLTPAHSWWDLYQFGRGCRQSLIALSETAQKHTQRLSREEKDFRVRKKKLQVSRHRATSDRDAEVES